ncbi:helix-turn-helix domain-containing protein [Nocardia tengchongensis]|uniref:Helix-turn-helix domain-containing protein n=1 Tax=Nocardia tengchongensis TaxID=2055889 RepID=A0ABX8CKM0_9NOCA|nr:helix-turn-helix transcriptional regulator [Nocardia tengchongensis]QVI19065.1 helix-turn-helix domain-containing protein [Nocardia tengchongensis]
MPEENPRASLPRRQLGRYIRRQREENTVLTQAEVAAAMQWSHSKYSRLERGEPGRILDRDLRELGKILEIPDEKTNAMIELARQVAERTWYNSFNDLIRANFDVYMRMETEAGAMEIYRPDLVPGLFQTADYARSLNSVYFPKDSEEEHDRRIELKLKRQTIITRKRSPITVDLVLHESALHTTVGNEVTMATQLRHLADLGTRPNISVRVLPFRSGFPLGMAVGPFVTLDFKPDPKGMAEPTVIYVESYTGDMYLEGEADVGKYRRAFATIQHAALDAVASRNLLRQVARRDSGQ